LAVGRWVTIAAVVALGALVFSWAQRVYGFAGGLLALVLCLFEPNLNAHGRLVTTDLYTALFIALTMYTLWLFTLDRRWWKALICGLALGVSLLVKFSAVLLFPVIAIVLGIRYGPDLHRAFRDHGGPGLTAGLVRVAGWIALIFAVSLLPLNAGYLFNGTGTPLAEYDFESSDFRSLQALAGPVASLPLPVPTPFIEGLDMVRHNEVTGAGRGPAYLFGRTQREPFPWYYPVVFALKIPLVTQALMLAAAVTVLTRRTRRQLLADELFFVLPSLLFAAYFTFVCRAQMGIRLALMVLPFALVLCGALGRPAVQSRRAGALVALALVLLAASVGSYSPHLLSYHNELAGDRKTTYRLLADSNLDWGQNEWYAWRYLREHPATVKNPPHPVRGEIMVSANLLTGIVRPGEYSWYSWVLENLEPVDHVAYSYLIFRITSADLARLERAGYDVSAHDTT
jgi:4-amino-4-deoxy-L-arabinose transferase-like glycosyltransferase